MADVAPPLRSILTRWIPRQPTPLQARGLLTISALFFGGMAVAARAGSAHLGTSQLVLFRFLLGAAGVGFVVATGLANFRATRYGLLALRACFGAGAGYFYFVALDHLSAGLASLLNYTYPVWAALFAAVFLREKITTRFVIGGAVATTGLAIVVGVEELSGFLSGLGDDRIRTGLLAGLISSICGGASTVAIRALRQTEAAATVFLAFCVGGIVVSLPGAVQDWRPLDARLAAIVLAMGLCSFGAQMLFTYSMKFVSAGAGSLATQLSVVFTYVLALLFLGEVPGAMAIVGSAVVVAGVAVASGR